jgi:ribosomal protein S18 acetylase RimI-like enzyme
VNGLSVRVVLADRAQAEACLPILADSILGTYFGPSVAKALILGAQRDDELLVAIDGTQVVGFAAVVEKGSFMVFPYLHLLAVKTSERSRGIGGHLLAELERRALAAPGYPDRPKVFLLVSHENPDAIRFYEAHGYRRMAAIDDMFGDGDTEFLYMKDLGSKDRRTQG